MLTFVFFVVSIGSLWCSIVALRPRDEDAQVIPIKYKGDSAGVKLRKLPQGDCIDLYTHNTVSYKKGDLVTIDFGVAMVLPTGYEAHIYPRSSTFEKYGLLLTNSVGIIDNAYHGEEDWWCGKFYATRDGEVLRGERVAQFRLVKSMPPVAFDERHQLLGLPNRGGYGTTGY